MLFVPIFVLLVAGARPSGLPPKTGPARMLGLGWLEGGQNGEENHTVEQIIGKLREAEVRLSQGETVGQVSRSLSITEQTYYRWRKEYGGLKVNQAKRLKELERENGRLRQAVADLTLDKLILKEASSGNF